MNHTIQFTSLLTGHVSTIETVRPTVSAKPARRSLRAIVAALAVLTVSSVATAKQTDVAKTWGVFPHATMCGSAPCFTGSDYVVSKLDVAPYSQLHAIRTYAKQSAALKFAEKLNGDE